MSFEAIRGMHPTVANAIREQQGYNVTPVNGAALAVNMPIAGINVEDTIIAVIDDVTATHVAKPLNEIEIADGRSIGSATMNLPNAADTVTANDLIYTGVAGVPANNAEYDVTSNATAADTLAASMNSRDGATITAISDGSAVVSLKAVAKGVAGNAITLAESTVGARQSVSGATLSEGTGVKASQTVQCTAIAAGESVTIRGLTYTAVLEANFQTGSDKTFSTGATPTDAECAANLAAAILRQESAIGNGKKLTAVAVTDTVTATAASFGTDANSIALSASAGSGFTLGGATLVGGVETSGAIRSLVGALTGRVSVHWYNKR